MSKSELPPERERFVRGDFSRGFIRYCGYEVDTVGRGRLVSRLDILEHHRQQDGFVHAGVMATMADHTAGYAAFTLVPENVQILTIEFKVNFLRPAYRNVLVCRSGIIREGKTVMVGESEVFDVGPDGEVPVAKAMVTLMPVERDRLVKPPARE
ncbi:MAG: PaaI family thioesterase [Desulfatibacillaceae bacterium]